MRHMGYRTLPSYAQSDGARWVGWTSRSIFGLLRRPEMRSPWAFLRPMAVCRCPSSTDGGRSSTRRACNYPLSLPRLRSRTRMAGGIRKF